MPTDCSSSQPVNRVRMNLGMVQGLLGCLVTVAQKRGAVCPPDALGSDLDFFQITGTDSTGDGGANRLPFQILSANHLNQQIAKISGSLISVDLIRVALVGDLNHGQSCQVQSIDCGRLRNGKGAVKGCGRHNVVE